MRLSESGGFSHTWCVYLGQMDKKATFTLYILFLRYKGGYTNFKQVSKVYNIIMCENETAVRERERERERGYLKGAFNFLIVFNLSFFYFSL